jgi:hypothetical protein
MMTPPWCLSYADKIGGKYRLPSTATTTQPATPVCWLGEPATERISQSLQQASGMLFLDCSNAVFAVAHPNANSVSRHRRWTVVCGTCSMQHSCLLCL